MVTKDEEVSKKTAGFTWLNITHPDLEEDGRFFECSYDVIFLSFNQDCELFDKVSYRLLYRFQCFTS